MARIVQKYGGSSLASSEHIKRVARHVIEEKHRENQIVVVVSAIGDTTDNLIQLAHEVCRKPPEREMDMLLSVGERISIALLAMAIQDLGQDAISFTGSQVGIITDDKHTKARILEVRATRLLDELEKNKIVIVAGFQGVSINKEITTLGRGGSDTTAIALAAALKADRCEIMKDVDGVYVAEPKLVPKVRLNEKISYEEMIEMADMGAGVLKTESIEMARSHNINIAVGSSTTGKIGTIVTDYSLESSHISGIVGQKGLSCLKINSSDFKFKNSINKKIVKNRIKVLTYLLQNQQLEIVFQSRWLSDVKKILEEPTEKKTDFNYSIKEELGLIAIIGTGLNFNSQLSLQILEALEKFKISPEMLRISQLRICWLMPENRIDETVRELYRELQ